MFKKLAKKAVLLLSAVALTFGAVGCQQPAPEGNGDYEIWTTYNTMKVVRDVELNGNYEKMDAAINVKMAKAESEMGNLYVTTGDKGVKEFNLVVQDLENENGDIFPVDNMEVYAQKYTEIRWRSRNNTYEEYPLGSFTPDAIVEMDLYREAKENKILPNSNQGFTVDFTTEADTPAGVYTGEFYLVLDNEVVDIPVTVTVWDYSVPLQATITTCNLIYEDSIKQGEMTSIASEVDDWYRTYYEVALKYRQSIYMVPESTKSPERFVANVVKYFEDPHFTAFGLPHQTFLGKYSGTYDDQAGIFMKSGTFDNVKYSRYGDCFDYWFESCYLLGLKAKETGRNYFEKMYIYPIDEPNGADQVLIAIEWFEDLEQFRDDVADQLIADGVFEADDPIIASVRDIDIVCTALGDEPALAKYDIVYVPEPYEIEDYSIQTNIEKHAENNENPLWYYTQIDKIGDGPNHFIDDFMVAGRVQGWMQQYYNMEGWLFWEFNQYLAKIAFVSGYEVVDPYENHNRDAGSATGCAGGGYWVLPASKYGADEPIKTLRLVTLRDSFEEQETLRYLDGLYNDYEEYYGLTNDELNINKVFKSVYDKIFTRSAVTRDDATFDAVRDILKDAVISAEKSADKFVYTVDYLNNDAIYSFYTAPGYQVKVNGQAISSQISGQGLKHTITIDATTNSPITSVQVVKDGSSTTKVLYESQTKKTVDIMAESFKITMSAGSSYSAIDGGYGYNFVIKSGITDIFIPQIKLSGLPSNFKVIELDIKNNTDEATAMYLRIVYKNGSSEMKDIGLTADTFRTVEVLSRSKSGSPIDYVQIRFDNRDENMQPIKDRHITLTGIRVR